MEISKGKLTGCTFYIKKKLFGERIKHSFVFQDNKSGHIMKYHHCEDLINACESYSDDSLPSLCFFLCNTSIEDEELP